VNKILLAMLLLVCSGAANAAAITYRLQGAIYRATDWATIAVGDAWTAEYTFDTDAPDDHPAPDVGSYFATSVTLTVGDSGPIMFLMPDYQAMVNVLDNYPGCDVINNPNCLGPYDSLEFGTFNGSSAVLDGQTVSGFSITLVDSAGTLFSGSDADALPLSLSIDDFNSGGFNIGSGLRGTVTSASVVPVPAAVWLFGSALAGLGWVKRKQTIQT